MTRGFFVTGSDTGVGKTVASAALCLGLGADYWKPVQAGLEEPSDPAAVAALAGLSPDRVHASRFALTAPRSPHEAAALDGLTIRLTDFSLPAPSGAPLIVEGAGGVLVPLNDRDLMLDLMVWLGLPVILAIRSGLGTINHALLSLRALRGAGLRVAGAIMLGEPDAANREAVARFGQVPILAEIPPLAPLDRSSLLPHAQALAEALAQSMPASAPLSSPFHPSFPLSFSPSPLDSPNIGVQGPMAPGEERVQGEGEEPSPWPPEASPAPAGSRPFASSPSAEAAIQASDARHVWRPFTQARTARPPIVLASGQGAELVASDGRRWLDMACSWWVNMHGHAHPRIAEAVARQARTLEQALFADFTHAPASELAARLAGLLPGGLTRSFFSDNGSTAVEVALKMALQYWRNLGRPERRRVVALRGAYHGDTFGSMSVGRESGYYKPFEPWLFEVDFIPFPATFEGDVAVEAREAESLAAFRRLAEAGDLAALIVEPLIQGAAGMRMCRPEYLRRLVDEARRADALVLFDEVMTGFGRTGQLFACQTAGTVPDVICLSKGLTGGFLPMAVTVCREEIHQAFLGDTFATALAHGHSYTANPLGCAAALASLELFETEDYPARAAMIEAVHRDGLRELADLGRGGRWRAERPRLRGTIAAFDLVPRDEVEPGYGSAVGQAVKDFCLARGVYARPMGGAVYLMPPYCVAEADLRRAWRTVLEAVAALG